MTALVNVQENAWTVPAAMTPLLLPLPLDCPDTVCNLILLLHRCWITIVRRDLTAAAFPRKPTSIPSSLARPQGVSLSIKYNPLLCLQCVSPHPALFHGPTSRFPGKWAPLP